MSKDLLVKLSVWQAIEDDNWFIEAKSPIPLLGHSTVCIAQKYKTQRGAINAAKRLLPLFVNAVLEE